MQCRPTSSELHQFLVTEVHIITVLEHDASISVWSALQQCNGDKLVSNNCHP